MIYKSAAELKSIARGKLLGKYSVAVGAIALMQLIFFAFNSVVTYMVDMSTTAGTIMYGAISIIVNLIAVVFVVGELTIYMNLACGNNAKVTDIFSGFSMHPDKAIVLEIIVAFRIFLWLIPACICAFLMYATGSYNYVLIGLTAVFSLVGLVGGIYTRIKLSQCLYLLLDFPQYSAKEIVGFSVEIMKGHMGSYFKVVLSFIPMYILGVLSAGIGFFFIYPYSKMTFTEFYLDIIREPQTVNNDNKNSSDL